MNSDRVRIAIVLGMAVGLGGCATNPLFEDPADLAFGDANRQTMMAQTINPDPVYTEAARSSGAHAADAVERYRTDTVKQPDTIRTTNSDSSQPDAD